MGPLDGIRVIELQGIGPGPFCGMMLADMGAEIIRIDRSASVGKKAATADVLARGRKSIGVDLKNPDGVETVLKLIETADVLIEGFRPGVTERLANFADRLHQGVVANGLIRPQGVQELLLAQHLTRSLE